MATKSATPPVEQLQVLLQRGFRSLSQGRIQEATDYCKRVLELKPDLVQGHFLVGLVALQAKDRETAFRAFASVTKLQKNHSAAWAHLAKLFMSDGQVNRADVALAEAIKNNPQDPMVHDLLGSIYSLMGEHGLAKSWFEKATTIQSDHPPFMFNLANNLIYHGRISDAETILRNIIRIQANSPQAHWSLAGVRKADNYAHIQQMQELLAQKEQHPRVQAFFYYGTGKELEDLQEWDEALTRIQTTRRRVSTNSSFVGSMSTMIALFVFSFRTSLHSRKLMILSRGSVMKSTRNFSMKRWRTLALWNCVWKRRSLSEEYWR